MKNKSYQLGQTKIIIDYSCVPKTKIEKIKNLTHLYDTVNKIANDLESKGIDTSFMFYTDKQIKSMQKDSKYNFI